MGYFNDLLIKNRLLNGASFVWNSNKRSFEKIEKLQTINLELIVGVDNQKKIVLNNTKNFSVGNVTNNVLLWGTRGNGKSTIVKSVFAALNIENKKLKLIQLNKNDIFDIENIYIILRKIKICRFIIFIDDLSFEKINSDYKVIKSTLDGSIQSQPTNIVLYVTSNRRHLMPREMIDNERSSAIHTDESVEEKISLSDRFGIWVGFHNLSQEDYLNIIISYCKHFKILYDENLKSNALKWSMKRGNRTGRTAWQYIIQIASEKNLGIKL